ncbi:TrkH-domain-containing protein [Zopfia rhizophila CBS 207.26]|uniref:TrkH-domain-containing protein n=1 Tax=Zopfia rhizophila CBS 207.26 TaxID=1314779 RepID=A0A6A6EBN0_9PEZI|nr:TrkH-domain-containing protein [Zopfia rhizophila CBS 207.26]
MRFLIGFPGFGPLRRVARTIYRNFLPLNFITLHYIYFLGTCIISSLIFYYTDSLFVTVSVMKLAGLNTVNLSTLTAFQQFMLFLLIIIGSAIFVSAFVVDVRKKAFEKRFDYIANLRHRRAERARQGRRRSTSLAQRLSKSLTRPEAGDRIPYQVTHNSDFKEDKAFSLNEAIKSNHSTGGDEIAPVVEDTKDQVAISGGLLSGGQENAKSEQASNQASPHGAESSTTPRHPSRTITYRSEHGDEIHVNQMTSTAEDHGPPEHITFGPNTYFRRYHANLSPPRHKHHRFLSMQGVGATHKCEYQTKAHNQSNAPSDRHPESALESASNHLPFSSSGFRAELGGCEYRAIQLLSWLVPTYFRSLPTSRMPRYWCIRRQQQSLRCSREWAASLVGGELQCSLCVQQLGMSLLDANVVAFQTSVYMLITMGLLILAGNTCYPIFLRLIVWTFLKLSSNEMRWEKSLCLNGIDWAAFEILNLSNTAITSLPTDIEVLDGLFQAFAIRSGGFYVVPIPSVRISLQVLCLPIWHWLFFGKLRRTMTGQTFEQTKSYFVHQQLRAQMAHDLWWIVLAVCLITIIEGSNFQANPTIYSVFNAIFEVVSGYGCVGISVELPDQAYSFSGGRHTLSKLILCAVMIRGSHRGLPVAIDKAVLLPGEHLHEAEDEDAIIRMERTAISTAIRSTGGHCVSLVAGENTECPSMDAF